MVRVLAQFDDQQTAFAAIQALIAASFDTDDLALRALRPDGTSPGVPIRVRSHVVHGFVVGAVIAVPMGIAVAFTSAAGPGSTGSFAALAAGVGAAAGAAIGIGSWGVTLSRRDVPADVEGFVAVVTVHAGRADAAEVVLREAGGRDASPRLIDPQ